MGKSTPPYVNYPQWTTARFFGFLRSALRAAYNKYPPKYEALKDAEVGVMTNKKTGRAAKHYECNICHKYFPVKEVQVDHKIDAGTLKTFEDLPDFCRKLFCSKDDLQVACKPCHQGKTNTERDTRKQASKKKPSKKDGKGQGKLTLKV